MLRGTKLHWQLLAIGLPQRSVLGPVLFDIFVMSIAFPLFTEPVIAAQKAGRVGRHDLSLLSPCWLFPVVCLFFTCPVTASRRYVHNLSRLRQPACSSLDPSHTSEVTFASLQSLEAFPNDHSLPKMAETITVSFSTLGCIPSPMDFCPACLQATCTLQYQSTSTYSSMFRSQCQEVQSFSCVFLENYSCLCSFGWEIKQETFLVSIPLLCN